MEETFVIAITRYLRENSLENKEKETIQIQLEIQRSFK